KIFSMTANLFVRTVFTRFHIHDWTGGFRAIRKDVFLRERNEMKGFNGYIFQIAFLKKAVRDGYKIAEVPVHFSDRKLGNSKIAPLSYIMTVIKFVILTRTNELARGSFGKFIIVGGFGFILNAVILKVLVDGFGWLPYLANLIGAVFAIFSNYNFNNFWSFKHHKATSIWRYFYKMFQFYLTSAFGVTIIQTGTIFIGTHFITREEDYFIYFLIGTSFLLVWNFSIYSRVIWRKKH
ncbi:MAG: GtrA family protein, partial [Candidatus Levybacteria bacterium]|nr:GtrA family protein [Candidatus Levybacteria bacterium]